MPKRQTGSRSLRKRAALLDYARPDSVSLKVAPPVECRPPVLKEIVDTGPIDCQPPEEDEPPSSGGDAPASEAPPAAPPAEATTVKPEKFGAYELIWEISKDAISKTYAVKNPAFEGMLALRIFNERITDSAQVRSIQKAALKSAELTHPNHAAVYDNGLGENGTPYVVGEWIEGEPLSELFRRRKRLDIASFLNIFGQINDVVAEAHSRNLMHGNLSPQKIIMATNDIEADIVKVIDFGMPVDPVQNAYYMSPEQYFDNNRVDVRSDIYSIGCMMYESLVGRPPSHGSQTTQNSVDFLHELANQYSKDSPEHNALKLLDCIIKRCLQKKAWKRFTSLRELNNALNLVADCFNNPGTKKLPRDAEKLLLFRFLDLFDKKITAAMMAYLILGLCATKYIGELQLQKYIDDGQLAMDADWPRAQTNFAGAIKQADLLGKPPSLKADLHWVLGDAYYLQAEDSKKDIAQDNLAKKAIAQYESAYEYYKRGSFSRAHALRLLEGMSALWYNMSDRGLLNEKRDTTLTQVESLWKAKNYSACANLANSFLARWDNSEIEKYARKAETKLAATLPPDKALYHLGRAQYYARGEANVVDEQDKATNKVMEQLKVHWQFQDTHQHYACQALLDGEELAAAGLLDRANYDHSHTFDERLNQYLSLKRDAYNRVDKDPAALQAIKPLEKALAMRDKYLDKDSEANATTLERLADCYRLAGDNQNALATYKRLFALTASNKPGRGKALLQYVDLLRDNGQAKAVPKILEEAIFIGHSPDLSNPMIIRLIEAYSQAGMRDRAEDTLALLADIPDAIAYDPRYVFDDYNNIIYKPEHYRPYLPKPKHIIKPVTQAWDPFASGSTASQAPPDAGPSYADDANF